LCSTWAVHQYWILPVGNIIWTESRVSFSSWIPFFRRCTLATTTWPLSRGTTFRRGWSRLRYVKLQKAVKFKASFKFLRPKLIFK
jgi:hypothetical protein